jgi:hypothetical protein
MTRWADYSAGRPSAAALKAAGFGGVLRYLWAGSSSKLITAIEYQDLVANGLQVALVVEQSIDDAWKAVDDYAQGQSWAALARSAARAMGIPDTVPIAAAADAHASGSQITDAVAYTKGFRDVLGLQRTGIYGFREVVTAVRVAGAASWFWLCGSAPSTEDQSWLHFWQRNDGTTTVSGVIADINEHYQPLPQEITMDWSDTIGTRKDGTPVKAGDALVNLYLGAYYGGGSAGRNAVFPTVNGIDAKVDNLVTQVSGVATQVITLTGAETQETQAVTQGQQAVLAAIADVKTTIQNLPPNQPVDVDALAAQLADSVKTAATTAVTDAIGTDNTDTAQKTADDLMAAIAAKLAPTPAPEPSPAPSTGGQ